MDVFEQAASLSVNDSERQRLLLGEARRQVALSEGDFIEMGVYRGGTALLLAQALREQAGTARLYLLDAWQGMPRPSTEDGQPWIGQGYFADASEAAVRNALAQQGLLDRCVIRAGWFEQTLSAIRGPFALAHVDCDYYAPVKFCLAHVLPRMAQQGVVIVDDHGPIHRPEGASPASFPGVAQAVREAIHGTDWQLSPLGGERDQSVMLRRAPDATDPLTLI